MSRGTPRGTFDACSGRRASINTTISQGTPMADGEVTSVPRLKSPLLYQLSYRDNTRSDNNLGETAPRPTARTSGNPSGVARLFPVSQSTLRSLFRYDAETGVFSKREAEAPDRPGRRVGRVDAEGYVRLSVLGHVVGAHRAAWLYVTGNEPPALIDHVNGDRADNRIDNLRAASYVSNATNATRVAQATGVWRRYGKIFGRIRVDGRRITAGPFASESECTAWYRRTSAELRGAFAPAVHQAELAGPGAPGCGRRTRPNTTRMRGRNGPRTVPSAPVQSRATTKVLAHLISMFAGVVQRQESAA